MKTFQQYNFYVEKHFLTILFGSQYPTHANNKFNRLNSVKRCQHSVLDCNEKSRKYEIFTILGQVYQKQFLKFPS